MTSMQIYIFGVVCFLLGWFLASWSLKNVFAAYEVKLKSKGEKDGSSRN